MVVALIRTIFIDVVWCPKCLGNSHICDSRTVNQLSIAATTTTKKLVKYHERKHIQISIPSNWQIFMNRRAGKWNKIKLILTGLYQSQSINFVRGERRADLSRSRKHTFRLRFGDWLLRNNWISERYQKVNTRITHTYSTHTDTVDIRCNIQQNDDTSTDLL